MNIGMARNGCAGSSPAPGTQSGWLLPGRPFYKRAKPQNSWPEKDRSFFNKALTKFTQKPYDR